MLKTNNFNNLFGVEPSVEDTAFVSPVLENITMINDLYKKEQFEEDTFDLITVIHVLDHLIDPNSFLETVAWHLKDKGIFFCVTHSLDCLFAKIFKERLHTINIEHISLFTEESLKTIIEKNGLKVIKIVKTYNNYTLAQYIERSPFKSKKLMSKLLQMCLMDKISLKLPLGNIAAICRLA